MIFVLVYVIVSAVLFVWVMSGARFKRLHSKTISNHPEMAEVRRTDPLLVVNFDGPPRSRGDEQSGDLGFARFLADHGTSDGDHDDS